MQVEPLRVEGTWVVARVNASAIDADIELTVRFLCPPSSSPAALRDRARLEALRYLDPA